MTCVIGLIEKNKVYIGSDSAGSGDHSIRTRKDEKVFQVGPMLIGYTTSFRMGQILRYSLKVPKQPRGKADFEYLTTDFVDAVRECLKSGGFARVDSGVEDGGDFLVGYKNKLYHISTDFQVAIPSQRYEAVGCGSDIAVGSMFSTVGQPGKKRILKALKAAEEFSSWVRGPFNVYELQR